MIVNGEKIDDAEIEREMDRLRPDYERAFADHDSPEKIRQLREWSEENVIERVLVCQEARKFDCTIPKEEIDSEVEKITGACPPEQCGNIREEVELRLRTQRLLESVCPPPAQPSPEQVRRFYEDNPESFRCPEMIRVAHIVKHIDLRTNESSAREFMEKVHQRLQAGESFESLARSCSDCPDNAGDLGTISRGRMVEEFDDVVFNLGTGETSGVFRTRFGFHIATVYSRQPGGQAPFEDVRDRIREQIASGCREKCVERFLDRIRASARIERD
jgi:hypothetical protein